MRDAQKQIKHEAITQAAYTLLAAKGYDGASMLSIAKASKASNETLYRWYGDKRGLFETMVKDNAVHIKTLLEQAIDAQVDPIDTLRRVAPLLLGMLLGDRAILLNRAAAADPSGELGAAISANGRSVIQPLIANVLNTIENAPDTSAAQKTDWFLGLLIGDLQIRRAIGAMPVPTPAQIEARSEQALEAFFRLLNTS